MWIATSHGFFSAVQDRDDPDVLRVRCRVRDDAEYLVGRMTSLGHAGLRIERDETADYLFRVLVPRSGLALFLAEEVLRIDWSNFKDRVKEVQGAERAAAYQRVWGALADLQELPPYSAYPEPLSLGRRWMEEDWATGELTGLDRELTAEEADELEAQLRFDAAVEAQRRKPRRGKRQRKADRKRKRREART